MSGFNRIAVYGHRGWASSAIVDALIGSNAPVRVLHRPGSDTSQLPANTPTVEVDLESETALVDALQDVDILISLVGHQDVIKQQAFVKAIPKTSVKLFVPSDMSSRSDEDLLKFPVLRAKADVEEAARSANIPTTTVWPGYLVESSLAVPLLGVDCKGNRIVYTGDAEHQKLNLCTRKYVAAAYASIFAKTPVHELQNRGIGLTEFTATGAEIATALERKHGAPPQVFRHSMKRVDEEIESKLQNGNPLAMVFGYRKPWGAGKLVDLVGHDIWQVDNYQKATLEDLIVNGKMESYKDLPPPVTEALNSTF